MANQIPVYVELRESVTVEATSGTRQKGHRAEQFEPSHDHVFATLRPHGGRVIHRVALPIELQLESKRDRTDAQAPFELLVQAVVRPFRQFLERLARYAGLGSQ